MKKLLTTLIAASLLALGTTTLSAQTEQTEKKAKKGKKAEMSQSGDTAPKSVIHIVTVNWKAEATPEQINAALEGVKKLPLQFKGITRVWTKPIKNQTDMKHVVVMEFADEQALKDYHDSDAQKEWYKSYLAVRERSRTIDVTN